MSFARTGSVFLVALICCAQRPNTLSSAERASGWRLLFDGKTLTGWQDPALRKPPGDSWSVEDGCIKANPHPRVREDLISWATFQDFEMVFDWRIAPGSNSGVKYLIQRTVLLDPAQIPKGLGSFEAAVGYAIEHPADRQAVGPASRTEDYVVSFEYQLVDNDRHPDARRGPRYQTAALYGLIPPSQAAARPVGEFNRSRLVVRGDRIEHWLNGVEVLNANLDSRDVAEGLAKRWHAAPTVAELLTKRARRQCPIALQNHGDVIWFRNLKIRPL